MKRFSLIFSLFCLFSLTRAQLSFNEFTYDFGEIKSGEVVSHTFKFTNVSGKRMTVETMQSSCKCVGATLKSTELAPGKEGQVDVVYNSNGQPKGAFTSSVHLLYDKTKQPLSLSIKGLVKDIENAVKENKVETPVYKDTVGSLVFERLVEMIGVLKTDEDKEFTFKVKNIGKAAIKFDPKVETKSCFAVSFSEPELKGGKEGWVKIKFLGTKSRDCGLVDGEGFTQMFNLKTNDVKKSEFNLTITGTYQRVFSEQELANAPTIEFETKEYVAGEIIQGQYLNYAFKFKNTGKSDLIIESAKASCGCTATAPKEKVIAPGASSEIAIQFDSKGKMGDQHKSVTVRSNDPKNGTVILHFKTKIIADPFGGDTGAPTTK